MSIFPGNSLPSGTTDTDRFARELALLLGVNSPEGSLQAEDLRVWGGGLASVYATESRAAAQIFPNSATDLLPAWEFRLGIPVRPNAATASRQAACAAKRAATGGDVRNRMLVAIRKIDSTAQIFNNTATAVTATNPRAVFRFVVSLSLSTLQSADDLIAIHAIVDAMKPAYTDYDLIRNVGFFCDDPGSLTDLDVLGH